METENEVNNTYKVVTPYFEGPFNLLLNLVEEKKLFINEISLAEVTEDYIAYINENKNLKTEEVSSFVVVAATLLLIKSKSLLPNLILTEEEEQDIHALEDRLKLYEFYSKLGINIKDNFGKNIIFLPEERKRDKDGMVLFLPDQNITKENMMIYMTNLLGKVPKFTVLPEVEVRKVINIEEVIANLTDRIQKSLSMNFKDFAGLPKTKEEKVFVIVGFLAMLELAREGLLSLVQENNFEDIIINKNERETNE